jgi:hypothetical protein
MLTLFVQGHFITTAMLLVGRVVLSKEGNKIADSFQEVVHSVSSWD